MIHQRWLAVGCFGLCLALAMQPAWSQVHAGGRISGSLSSIRGRPITAEAMKGKVLLLHTWSSESPGTAEQVAALKKIYETYQPAGLEMFSICLDAGSDANAIHAAATKVGYTWDVISDGKGKEGSIWSAFNGQRAPEVYLFDGFETCRWVGSPQQAMAEVAKLLKDVKPPGDEPAAPGGAALEELPGGIREAVKSIRVATQLIHKDRDYAGALKAIQSLDTAAINDEALLREALPLLVWFNSVGEDKSKIDEALKGNAAATEKLNRLTAAGVAVLLTRFSPPAPGGASRAAPSPAAPNAQPSVDDSSSTARLAMRKIEEADRDRDAGRDVEAYQKYKQIVEKYPNTASGREAAEVVRELEANQAFMDKVKAQADEAEARRMLDIAKGYARARKTAVAKKAFEEIVKRYPNTPAGTEAATALKELGG